MKPRIRGFTSDDYGSVVGVLNSVYADYPTTVEEIRFNDEHNDPKCLQRRWVAEDGGAVVGTAEYVQHVGMYHPRKFSIDLAVRPDYPGRRIGAELYDHLMAALAPLDPISLRVPHVRADQMRGIRFLRDRGFVESLRSWESRLDVARFDPAPYAVVAEAVQTQGIAIATIVDLAGDPERNRKLHALETAVSLDIPHAEPVTPVSYQIFVDRVMGDPTMIPDAWFIAVHDGRYVGSSNLWQSNGGENLYIGLTGVIREYRRRGIALALKLQAIAWAREHGQGELRTWNDSTNRAILAINERLGFIRQPIWISWNKTLHSETI